MGFSRNVFLNVLKKLDKPLSAQSSKKSHLLYLSIAVCLSTSNALEFGTMGNMSAGMGGAGVALKNSSFGLYYNPALLAATPKIRLGYSAGVNIRERNIARLGSIDLSNMQDTATRLGETFKGGGDTSGVMKTVSSALDSVLASQGSTGQSTQDKLTAYINSKGGSKDYSDLISAIKNEVNKSNDFTQVQKDLLNSVMGSVDFDSLGVGGSGSNAKPFNITISKGSDKGLDKSMSDIAAVKSSLQDNHINLNAQGGVVFQLGSAPINEELGTLAAGYFGSMYSSISLRANPNRLGLILESGGQYYELQISDSGYTYKLSDKNTYDSSSLIGSLGSTISDAEAHKITISSLVLTEIPIGYARTFYTPWGNLSLGASYKIMSALSKQKEIAIRNNTDIGAEMKNIAQDFKNLRADNAFGTDIGALYEIDLPTFRYLTIGLVAKNVNSPTFQSTLGGITIKPQVRAGVAYYRQDGFNVAFDADLTQNDIIAFTTKTQKSQMIGGGVGIVTHKVDARFGMMVDIAQDNGLILTGGVNLLGILDVALQTSTRFSQIQGYPIPQYFSVRIGGEITW
ncbi:conjugal transfer protein TraF [Helicobacter sp. 23-1048]